VGELEAPCEREDVGLVVRLEVELIVGVFEGVPVDEELPVEECDEVPVGEAEDVLVDVGEVEDVPVEVGEGDDVPVEVGDVDDVPVDVGDVDDVPVEVLDGEGVVDEVPVDEADLEGEGSQEVTLNSTREGE